MQSEYDKINESHLPQWSQNKLHWFQVKTEFDALIEENRAWIRYFEAREQYALVVLFKERILVLEKAWSDFGKSCEAPPLNSVVPNFHSA